MEKLRCSHGSETNAHGVPHGSVLHTRYLIFNRLLVRLSRLWAFWWSGAALKKRKPHTEASNLQPDLVQRRVLHQLKRSRVDLAVAEVDLLVELHLFPLCNLQSKPGERRTNEERVIWI